MTVKEGQEIGEAKGEAKGREIGLREGLEIALASKFDEAGQAFADSSLGRLDLGMLQQLKSGLRQAKTLEEVRQLIAEPAAG